MPTFDVVSRTDLNEVDNAINGIKRETQQRFDLKGTKCDIERNGQMLIISADDDLRLKQMHDLLGTYLARRKVDSAALEYRTPENASGGSLRQTVVIRQGVETELGRKIIKAVKGTKLKVQVSAQGEELRVSAKNRDDLQTTIAFIREMKVEQPLQYINFRE
jgi:uncharacterized protein YajQ (UPF0234 family)